MRGCQHRLRMCRWTHEPACSRLRVSASARHCTRSHAAATGDGRHNCRHSCVHACACITRLCAPDAHIDAHMRLRRCGGGGHPLLQCQAAALVFQVLWQEAAACKRCTMRAALAPLTCVWRALETLALLCVLEKILQKERARERARARARARARTREREGGGENEAGRESESVCACVPRRE